MGPQLQSIVSSLSLGVSLTIFQKLRFRFPAKPSARYQLGVGKGPMGGDFPRPERIRLTPKDDLEAYIPPYRRYWAPLNTPF